MSGIGDIPMPPGFRYKKVYARGRPRHAKTDAFRIRHPRMTLRRRAKLFAPFDALRGFSGAVAAKNVQYERKRVLNEEDLAELDRRMRILLALTGTGPLARQNRVRVSVTWYVPCQDPDHEAFGVLGSCQTLTGICLGRDPLLPRILRVGEARIPFDDIYGIEAEGGLFEEGGPDPEEGL